MFIIILSLNTSPPLYNKLSSSSTMPKAKFKSTSSDEEELHGFINPVEAKAHVNALEDLMTKIKKKVEQKETTGLLDEILAGVKEVLSNLTPLTASHHYRTASHPHLSSCSFVLQVHHFYIIKCQVSKDK